MFIFHKLLQEYILTNIRSIIEQISEKTETLLRNVTIISFQHHSGVCRV